MAMQSPEKLSITLPAEMVRIIHAKVEAGDYADDSEVVREAMGGWIERERHFATLEAAIDRGIAESEAGLGMTSAEVRNALLEGLMATNKQPGS
jgi:antitoxin ParD1/3/4